MRIHIINGPNLNLLGTRETDIYGSKSFEDYLVELQAANTNCVITYFQSNVEGDIINDIQNVNANADALVINPAGYSHTSVAIADALAIVTVPVIEVHISNIYKREVYRHITLTGAKCDAVISGAGLDGYQLAISHLQRLMH
jgi:3-dehydroquinate dehydratase II